MTGPSAGDEKTKKVTMLQAKESDNELMDVLVSIPESENVRFSWRKLWAFTGPGFLMSIAFLDPGNIEADLKAGGVAKYEFFWVLFWSTFLGLLMQRLSARVGTVTGQHMAEICYTEYKAVPRIFLWLMMEVAIIGSDMQEVIGTAISLYLLSNKHFPLWAGVLVTVVDTFTFLFLDKFGLRVLELFFAILISVMAVTFGYEFFVALPDFGEIMKGIVIPVCTNCNNEKMLQAVGIVGACIMPHNLYLHSGLVKTRDIDRKKDSKISEANFYFLIESAGALFVSFIINLFVMAVFAQGLWHVTNNDVRGLCMANHNPYSTEFPANNQTVDVDIYKGGIFLGCQFGIAAMYIWAVGILAAGQSSTMTGCYAGQFAMEGFLNLTWVRWKRVLFTRSIAIIPSFLVAFFSSMDDFSLMNDFLNALMSLQLPFAVLPAIAFTSNTRIMGNFANGVTQKIISMLIFIVIFAMNTKLVLDYVSVIEQTWIYILVGIYFVIYLVMCVYLLLHCLAALTSVNSWLNRHPFMLKYILGKSITEFHESTQQLNTAVQSSNPSIYSVTDNMGK